MYVFMYFLHLVPPFTPYCIIMVLYVHVSKYTSPLLLRCKSLDCLAIVEYLREKLKSAQSQVVLVSHM